MWTQWPGLIATGFWTRLNWLLFQKIRLPEESTPRLVELAALLRPFQAQGESKTRLGRSRDGGYVMLDDFEGITTALSLGIGDDVSWDLDLARRGIPVEQYDHTIPRAPKPHPLFTFHPQRVAAVADCTGPGMRSLTDLLQEARDRRQDLILKIDIEGDEWEIFAQIDPELLKCVRQITGEFHGFREVMDDAWYRRATLALTRLTMNHAVVHLHGNNIGQRLVAGGIVFPESLEITLANRERYRLAPNREPMPGRWDRRNHPARPEIPLRSFLGKE